jgi:hypothetical protein
MKNKKFSYKAIALSVIAMLITVLCVKYDWKYVLTGVVFLMLIGFMATAFLFTIIDQHNKAVQKERKQKRHYASEPHSDRDQVIF